MAAPVLGKCAAVFAILAVILLYDGRAFKIRDVGQVEQNRGTCASATGKCPAAPTTHLHRRKLERVSIRGTFAKIQRPPVDVHNDDEGGQSEEKVTVRSNVKSARTEPGPDKKEDDSDEEEDAVVEDELSAEVDSVHSKENGDDDDDSNDNYNDDDDDDDEDDKDGKDNSKNDDDDDDDDDDDKDRKVETEEEDSNENKLNITTKIHSKEDSEEEIEENSEDTDTKNSKEEQDKSEDKSDDKVDEKSITVRSEEDKSEVVSKIVSADDDIECSDEDEEAKTDDKGDSIKSGNYSKLEKVDKPENVKGNVELKPEVKTESVPQPLRKLEKVKYADKDKIRKANASSPKYAEAPVVSVIKESPVVQPVKLTDNTKHTEAVKPMSKNKEANSTSSLRPKPKNITKSDTTKVVPKIVPQSTVSKSSKQNPVGKLTETTTKPKVSKSQQVDAKHATAKPKKRSDGPITLAELNDAILSVPTFVLNFTAVEDSACQQHGKIFLRQLRGFKLWALQMLDSTAKIPAGLLRGNVNQFGDFDQCLGISTRVKINEQIIKIQGKYCLATVDLHAIRPHMKVPENLMQSRAFIRGNMHDPGHFIPRFTTINWALCLPAACSADDAKKAVEDALQPYNSTLGIKFSIDVDPNMCYVKQKSQGFTKETIGVLYFYAMILCLVITASIRDYFVRGEEKGNYAERIIMSFSLQRNIRALLKDNAAFPEDVTCIHGIRSLSTVALYIAHKLIPTCRMPYANRVTLTEVANNPISSILRVSLVYTDSFLLLSGVLTAYNMAKELTVRGEIRWFCRFVTRYIRLTPSLLVIIFWYTFVMEHVGSGPQWNSVIKANADICKKNAWTNLLYIQNFFPFEEMCATHTHQLALDMQLSLAAPILVYFLRAKPVIGALLIFFLLQVSATLRYFAVAYNNLSLVIFHGMTLRQLYKTANLTYVLSMHRATPYLLGIVLGVFLQYAGKNVHIHKFFVLFGWVIAAVMGSWSIFSPWRLARRDYTYDIEEAASYAVISPILSSLALCWVIFACFTNHGGFINKLLSNYWLIIFSRISYAIYLTQFAVFFYNVASTRYSSEFEILRAINLPEFAIVVFISVVITLFFDIPMQEVKNVLLECTHEGSGAESSEKKDDGTTAGKESEPKGKDSKDRLLDEKVYEKDSQEAKLKRQEAKKQSLIRSDAYDSEEPRSYSRSPSRRFEDEEDDRDETYIRERYVRLSRGDEYEIRRRERSSSRASTRSNKEDYGRSSRMEFRDRPSSLDSEEGQSWEFVRRERSLSRNRDVKKVRDYSPRSHRLAVPEFVDHGPSSGSEDEKMVKRERKIDRKPAVAPRISDEEDWDEDMRIKRGSFSDVIEDEEMDSLRRRSSAEGKIALLQEPIDSGSMDFWTVSKVSQLGSSIEPSEPEDEGIHRNEPREVSQSEEDSWNKDMGQESVTSGSQITSADEEDVTTFDFVLRKDSKRITVQDLSKLSPDRELAEKSEDSELVPRASSGLFKRESIIKSQASEEDPEYLLPERPKLQEQEQDHPFKKAWQQQKSRSEEDGTSGYAIKEIKKPESSSKSDDGVKEDTVPSGEKAVEHEVNYNWQGKSIEIEETQESLKPEVGVESEILNWPSEEEQFECYKALHRKKKEENNCVLWEDDDQNEIQ